MDESRLSQDYLISPDKPLWQHKDHFRFNTDTRLLAGFMQIKKGSVVYDFGTNNAALLQAADAFGPASMVGIEIQAEACQVAWRNAQSFQSPCTILQASIQEADLPLADVIVSNPPFFPLQATHPDTVMTMRQLGRMESLCTLQDLVAAAARLLKSSGHFQFVHRPQRLNEIMETLHANHFSVARMALAYDTRDNQCKAVLLDCVKDRQVQLKMEEIIWIS